MLNLSQRLTLTDAVRKAPNLADRFGTADLSSIGEHVWEGYNLDKQSRRKWEKRTDAAMNLAMQVVEGKNFPWAGCSNIKFPLVTIAAMQFHSRAYPTIVQGTDIVKMRVVGADPDGSQAARAKRVGTHMSYQCLEEDQAWEEQHDRLLISIPIVGTAFKKSFQDGPINKAELVLAQDLVVDYFAKSIESCARKTHIIPLYRNDVYEKVQSGVFRDVLEEPWYKAPAVTLHSAHEAAENKRAGTEMPKSTEDTPFTFLEQHCWLDLDGDGYQEPYIVTIEIASHCVVRITARWEREEDIIRNARGKIMRITAHEYFTKYGFIPSADGSIYDVGFGVLLGPLNETTNSLINQLVDAGTMSNAAGGFLGRGAKIRGGSYTFAPLEWKRVDSTGDDLRKNIVPLTVREPSMVLFQLLSLVINYTGKVAGTTETTLGENPGQNTPAQTTQSMIEQGSKVYSAIFKRIWRSMKEEFRKRYILNAIYMPTKQVFGANGMAAMREDYLGDPSKVVPVADPNITSTSMRFQQALAIKNEARSTAGYDMEVVERNFLQAMQVDGIDTFYPGPKKIPSGPSEKIQLKQMELQYKQMELKFEQMKFVTEMQNTIRLNQAQIAELSARAAHEVAQANGVEAGHQIAAFEATIGMMKLHNENMHKQVDHFLKHMEIKNGQAADGAGVAGLDGASGDQSPSPIAGSLGGGA